MKHQTNQAAGGSGEIHATSEAAPVPAASKSDTHTMREVMEAISAAAPVAAATKPVPEFVPMPTQGQIETHSGLKRGMLYQLDKEGLIRTVSLRRKGTTRARRLIVLESLMAYLRSLDVAQNGAKK